MKKYPLLVLLIMITWSCDNGEQKKSNPKSLKSAQLKVVENEDKEKVERLKKQDCVEVIRCLSAKTVADEAGMSEMWAIRNYKVSVWERPSHLGKGKIVGEMRCGSRAIIIDRTIDDYKVISPLDQSIGWVNKIQIERTSYQHPITREACNN
tara:strand:- start:235 stop:690 length:456 start_codon:yes stop_codon:yes gene_type:complete